MSEWQPIESAPKDGARLLLTNGCSVWEGSYDVTEWLKNGEPYRRWEAWTNPFMGAKIEPTHWMPRPPLPAIGDNG